MADGAFINAKGKIAYYAGLPAANDALIVVLLKAANLEGDDSLNNYTDLASLLAASNDECDFTNYSRKTLTVTVTVDNTANVVIVDAADFTYTAAGGAANNDVGKLLVCYDPDTTSGIDSVIPLTFHDCVFTTNGADVPISVSPAGIWQA